MIATQPNPEPGCAYIKKAFAEVRELAMFERELAFWAVAHRALPEETILVKPQDS